MFETYTPLLFQLNSLWKLVAEPSTSSEESPPPEFPTNESFSGSRLLRRFHPAVMRMRKELPPTNPRKLCFQTTIPGCTHAEVVRSLEGALPDLKVASLQYDPIHLHDYRDPLLAGLRFKCMWVFTLSPGSDSSQLLLRGFRLRGQRMNVRKADDVYAEEQRAFQLCWEMFRRGLLAKDSRQQLRGGELDRLDQTANNNNDVYKTAERKPAHQSKKHRVKVVRDVQPAKETRATRQRQRAR
ncbi:hypothetical protein ElyMa_005554200 [Elysia marginata]|uniref:Uncharacterized protein n=1 Tax=Elysia marginata TaxID=1093978 RepID=A0AAV4F0N4_9GAST|nr:hypothetical protein ElyMa_005554200 [Elysia marginata]